MVDVLDQPEAPAFIPADPADYHRGPQIAYVLAADLGQSIDNTALCLIEREIYDLGEWEAVQGRGEGTTDWRRKLGLRFTIRALKLLPLGMSYQAIVAEIVNRQKQTAQFGKCNVVFDETGARAAGDMIRKEIPRAIGCTLTASEKDAAIDGKRWSISKANMVTGLLAAIDNGQLVAAEDLEEFPIFKSHLVDLRRKVSALGHMSFNAREGAHDDFVTAAGLAWWFARHRMGGMGTRMVHITGL